MRKSITKEWCKENILLAKEEEYELGWDQCDVTYPCSFPTVTFYLPCTNGLIDMADDIRAQKTGYPPLSKSETGWYNFYAGLNGYTKTHTDSAIMFTVNDETAEDDFESYAIDLDETEQAVLYAHLSELAKVVYGKDAEALLTEAREYYDD